MDLCDTKIDLTKYMSLTYISSSDFALNLDYLMKVILGQMNHWDTKVDLIKYM